MPHTALLQNTFGFDAFRPGQEAVINALAPEQCTAGVAGYAFVKPGPIIAHRAICALTIFALKGRDYEDRVH